MKALIIMLVIAAFFTFLLVLPVNIYISFQERLTLKIKYLFFSFEPLSKNLQQETNLEVKEEAIKVNEKQEDNKSTNIKDLIKQTGLDGFLKILSEISKLCKDMIKSIMGHTIINNFDLNISVSDDDASKTALYYATICSTVYPSVNIIINSVKNYQTYNISIIPDFQKCKSKVDFNTHLKIKLLFLLTGCIVALFKLLKIILKIKKNNI